MEEVGRVIIWKPKSVDGWDEACCVIIKAEEDE